MKKQKTEKTNVMRIIEQHKLPYESHDYSQSGAISGMEVVKALGQQPGQMFKTLALKKGGKGGR